MAVKADAENILKRNLKARQAKQDADDKHKENTKVARIEDLLTRLLSGKQMSAKDGREFFYEYICNNSVFKHSVFTGNSETYKRIGEQEWARDLMQFAKLVDIKLYHKMEIEAIDRNKEDK